MKWAVTRLCRHTGYGDYLWADRPIYVFGRRPISRPKIENFTRTKCYLFSILYRSFKFQASRFNNIKKSQSRSIPLSILYRLFFESQGRKYGRNLISWSWFSTLIKFYNYVASYHYTECEYELFKIDTNDCQCTVTNYRIYIISMTLYCSKKWKKPLFLYLFYSNLFIKGSVHEVRHFNKKILNKSILAIKKLCLYRERCKNCVWTERAEKMCLKRVSWKFCCFNRESWKICGWQRELKKLCLNRESWKNCVWREWAENLLF